MFIPNVLESVCKLLIYVDANFNRDVVVKTKDGKIKGVMRQAQPTSHPEFPLLYSAQHKKEVTKKLATLPLRAFFSLMTDILRISSTLVHVNKEAQNFIFENQYHIPLLSFSAFDKANPLTRETTILLIRYLTDGNDLAKKEISKLDVKRLDEDGVKDWNKFCKDMESKE